jgi:hypothetical protein
MYKIIGGDQREYGPVDFNSLLDWIRQGRANAQTLVQKEGGPWAALGTMPEFAEALAAQTATLPPPGAPPAANGGHAGQGGDRSAAQQAVQVPAILLLIHGILSALRGLWTLVQALLFHGTMVAQQRAQLEELPPEAQEMAAAILDILANPAIAVGSSLLALLTSVLIVYGGLRMKALQSYALAVTAAILAMLPCNCPCCCLGLPVGIWALVVLLKPEVKAAFR